MKQVVSSILLIALTEAALSQPPLSSEIAGKVIGASEQHIKIGNDDVPLAASGEFRFQSTTQYPIFLDIQCGKLSWAVYLEPGKHVELEVKESDLSSLKYGGDLAGANSCLKNISLLQPGTNEFFNNNWVKIHSQEESRFIALIDSLKNVYRGTMKACQMGGEKVSSTFVNLLNADIDFGFNALVVDYPEVHQRFTGEHRTLSRNGMDYLAVSPVNDTTVTQLASFKKYCKKWVDYNADLLIEKSTERKHYNLLKMDLLPTVLSAVFRNQSMRDYWFSEYLREQIDNCGIANSEKYVTEFDRRCTTPSLRSSIDQQFSSYETGERDHVVKSFKTENGFVLKAHLFYPDGIRPGEKRPAIVIFYGGGLVLGNASWGYPGAKRFAGKGMIGIAAQYRLCNFRDVTPIESIADAKDLMLWLRKNADSLGIDADKIAASGWSMGAQLCATLAIFPDTLPGTKIQTSPNALLLTSPGTDARGWFTELLNGAKVNPLDLSPVDHVRSGLPPTIILEGRDDSVTPLKDVQLFHDKLVAAGDSCEMWIYDGVGHLFTPTALGDNGWPRPDPRVQEDANAKADAFLARLGYFPR
ncbi:MAG TPA: alpha/beta hydrolase [Bacteroidota bacterium]|nr:alpha/beta hydrolase [Bacteroidota bacterium]